jgi:hypothetical protein
MARKQHVKTLQVAMNYIQITRLHLFKVRTHNKGNVHTYVCAYVTSDRACQQW